MIYMSTANGIRTRVLTLVLNKGCKPLIVYIIERQFVKDVYSPKRGDILGLLEDDCVYSDSFDCI